MTSETEPKPHSIARRMAKGSAWSVAMRISERSLGLLSTLILARILAPQDYGLVAMATGVAAIVEAVGAFGFEWALIQRQKGTREYLDTAWTLNLLLALAKGAVLLAMAPLAAGFYGDLRVGPVLWALAGASAAGGLRNIGMVRCEIEMDFQPVFALTVSRKLVSMVVAVSVAMTYGGHWALVWGIVASSLADAALSYLWQPYRPRWCLAVWRELFSFSQWLLLNNLLTAIGTRANDLILGRTLGSADVGTYSIAKELASLPTTELATPLMRSFFPGYARLSEDRRALVREYRRVFGMMALLFVPAAIGVACVAEPMVQLMLGPKWTAVIPVMRVLAVVGAIHVVQSNMWPVYLAIGRPKTLFLLGVVGSSLFMPSFWLATAAGGVMYGAYVALGVAMLMGTVNLSVMSRVLSIELREILRPLVRPAIASAVMAGVLSLMSDRLPHALSVLGHAGNAAVLVPAGAVTYALAILLLWTVAGRPESSEREALELARRLLVRAGLAS